jgi:superfamily II DNA or RNA helicase
MTNKTASFKLRPYQTDIIETSLSYAQEGKNTLIMLPTGGGKTVIAKSIAQKSTKNILFLAPKIELLNQTVEEFQDLSPQVIHGSSKYDAKQRIFVSTLQTFSRRIDLLDELGIDLIIIDEIHYGASGKMQDFIKKKHSGCVIGLSATPYDSNGVLLDGFDAVIDKYDIAWMVKNKYLCNVEAVVPLNVDLKSVSITAGDYNLKELDFKMNTPAMLKAVTDATIGIIQKRKKIIVFAVSIKHAKALTKIYKSRTTLNIDLLHSEQPKEKQQQVIDRFKNKNLDVIISINMITTGFNSPNIDTVVIARPTRSQNLYKQMIGRGMRLYQGKKSMLLVDCGNVCTSLGMPLDPIKEKPKTSDKQIYECVECGSKKPRVKGVVDNSLHTYCPDCLGIPKPYTEREPSYICERCSSAQDHEALIINKYGIYLACLKCKKTSILELFEDIEWGSIGDEKEPIFFDVIFALVFSSKRIFFKNIYKELLREDAVQRPDKYLSVLLENDKDAHGVYKISESGINYKKFEKMIAELSVRELRSLSLRFIKEHGHNIDVDEVKAFIVKEEREFLLINNSSMGPLEYKTIAFKRIKVLL